MSRQLCVWFAVLSLVVAGFPAAASEGIAATQPPTEIEETALGDVVSGGSGGYIPLTPARLAELEGLEPDGAVVLVAGVGGVPEEGIGAVVLNLAIGEATRRSSLTVWPAGAERPDVPTISVDDTRDWATTAVVRLGEDGMVSLAHTQGRLDIDVDVLGWFPDYGEYVAVGPARAFDTSGTGRLTTGQRVDVALLGVHGIPEEGVGAVVLNVTSTNSTEPSGITLWPAGEEPSGTRQLVTEPRRTRSNLAIVTPGVGGAISVRNHNGATHLALDVVGWIPAGGAYRAVDPGQALDGTAMLRQGHCHPSSLVDRGGTHLPGGWTKRPLSLALTGPVVVSRPTGECRSRGQPASHSKDNPAVSAGS